LRREFEARTAAGFDVEWWPRRRVGRESSLPHPAALLSRGAAEIDPYRLTYGLLAAVQRQGGRMYDRTAVTKIQVQARGVTLTTSRGCEVRARQVVIATGYESGHFLADDVTALHSTFALVTEPVSTLAGWPVDRAVLWDTARPYLYLRVTSDNRLLIGGYDEPYRDPRRRDAALPRKAVALQRRLRRFFPRIEVQVDYAWAGTFADTPHGLPVIGRHPDKPRHYFALGYGGNGLVFSLIAAEIIREAILGRGDPDAELFGFERAFR
jgi:glycine/D-amino acid oxidase-like deaminating enzyme